MLLALAAWLPAGRAVGEPRVYIVGDMEKHSGGQSVEDAPAFLEGETITLHGAGNEVIAFQVVLQAYRDEDDLSVRVGELSGPGAPLEPRRHIRLFRAHYIKPQDASYSWGGTHGRAGVLRWRNLHWPDALIPFHDPYSTESLRVGYPFAIDPRDHRNQAVWVDVWIPRGTAPGEYTGRLEVLQATRVIRAYDVRLAVHPFDLPDEAHVDAFGELYREEGVMFDSGVKFKQAPEQDWPIYTRYVQMAHAHRFLALHRPESGPLPLRPDGEPADRHHHAWSDDWSLYEPYMQHIYTGDLFTSQHGYDGPRAGAPPSFMPAPFIEAFFGAPDFAAYLEEHKGEMGADLLRTWEANARAFWKLVTRRGWQDRRYFAYILDEVDGPEDHGDINDPDNRLSTWYVFHKAMADIQAALDRGTGGRHIHLLWTSHSDPSVWVGTRSDLTDTIRWWVPKAHALNLEFFRPIADDPGQTVWFYHSGHPSIGNHTINQLGIDLRIWGLTCWRYDIQGSFWWSMMNFPQRYDDRDFVPYERPIYKFGETRWGNGVLFYPGARLEQIGAARGIAGPIPSMRMKAYRRGLQDYEYLWLAARAGQRATVDAWVAELIPAALGEAPGRRARGKWSSRPEDYYALRRKLAELIAGAPAAERTGP